jgi:type II secretory pathway pseudopilin PulG
MRIPRFKKLKRAAFTLIELMVSTGVVTIAGTGIFLALQSGLNLYAKNTSVNVAHQQLLKAVQRISRDAHAAVDVPELLDASLTVVANGPAAGVSFQIPWQKPFKMTTGATGGTAKITIDTNSAGATPSPRPSAGQRAYLPGNDNTEDDIILVAANTTNSAYSDITFQNNLWKTIRPNSGSYIRPVVIVDRVA